MRSRCQNVEACYPATIVATPKTPIYSKFLPLHPSNFKGKGKKTGTRYQVMGHRKDSCFCPSHHPTPMTYHPYFLFCHSSVTTACHNESRNPSGKKSGPQIQDSSGPTFLLVPGLRRDDDEGAGMNEGRKPRISDEPRMQGLTIRGLFLPRSGSANAA